MEGKLKRELVLEGLDCANCAAKIEKRVNELEGVSTAKLNFMTKILTIESEDSGAMEQAVDSAIRIVNSLEPDVRVEEKKKGKSGAENKNSYLNDSSKQEIIKLASGAILYAAGLIFKFSPAAEFILFLTGYLIVGGEVLLRAFKNILKGQVFDENFLMAVATIGAFAVRQFPEAVAVMLFYQIGEFFQDMAVNRSRRSITALMDIRADYANLKIGENIRKVSPEEVGIGDIIVIKPGEKIPLDGIVTEGGSMIDTSALTGESIPREVESGSQVLSGFVNKNGLLTVRVEKNYGESAAARIIDLVQNASSRKAAAENFITKFARYYTPVVVLSALLLAVIPPLVIPGAAFSEWIYRALIFLVISCPCALVISIPLSFFGGIGGASRNGILIKGSNYLEALNSVEAVVFDKTGTLTKGVFKVTEIHEENGFDSERLLKYAAYAEVYSNHPIAVSILKEYSSPVDKNEISDYAEIPGHGVRVRIKGQEVLAGSFRLMTRENIAFTEEETAGTVVHVAVDGIYAGYIVISDEIKEDSAEALKKLKGLGIGKLVMLTGDSKAVSKKIAEGLMLDEVYSELLPDEKVEKLEMLEKQKSLKGKIVFVGDGVNDAPVLARADIGVAMGGLGSDAAIEAADVVLMTDEPLKLLTAIRIARRTKVIVWQNIVFAMGVKVIVLLLGAGGMATLWEAVFADVGVALIAVINSMRAMSIKNELYKD